MSSDTTLEIHSEKPEDTLAFGVRLGAILKGGEIIELIGDLGAGKTQLVRGIAQGIGSDDVVQSPSFTISRIYKGDDVELHHYDFYRLGDDPGIMKAELAESIDDQTVIVVTEWAQSVEDVLPEDKLSVRISYGESDTERTLDIQAGGDTSRKLLEQLS